MGDNPTRTLLQVPVEFLLSRDNGSGQYVPSTDLDSLGHLPEIIINKLVLEYKRYSVCGGMPAAAAKLIDNQGMAAVDDELRGILDMYELDFSKYAEPLQVSRINALWHSLPSQLSKENRKFIYKVIRTGARAKDYEDALTWLEDAGLIYRIFNVSKPGMPLSAYSDIDSFKVYVSDCGLLRRLANIPPEVIQAARERKTAVLSCPHDTYTCARLINQCVPVSQIMQTEVVRFKPTDMLSDIKGVMEKHKHRYYPVEENGKLVGMVSSEGVMVPEKTKVILVDHNERSQAIEGVEKARILEIVDHHRLGGIQTNEPIFTRQDPVGCTCTIIADMHIHRQVAIPPQIAGLMLSAIISDTVLFKSPTCTEHDKEVAQYLSKIAGIDIEKYGMEMLKAGTDIDNMSADEIVKNDMKEFLISHYRISISQCSVMDKMQAESRKDEILAAAEEMRKREGYDLSIIMITNIMEEASILIFSGEPKSLVGEAFKVDTRSRMVTLPDVMSRKKQVVPPLSEAAKLVRPDNDF